MAVEVAPGMGVEVAVGVANRLHGAAAGEARCLAQLEIGIDLGMLDDG